MAETDKLTGTWVEIQERGDESKLFLMRPDADVPPSRGGRRHLELAPEGGLFSFAQGAVDSLESKDQGNWSLNDNTLQLQLKGWEGEYTVETMTDTELILNRR